MERGFLYFTMRFDFLANIFFPPICLICRGRIGRGVACESCLAEIPIRDGPVRPDLWAATNYSNTTVQALIHNLKFRSIRGAAEPLAELLFRYLNSTNGLLTQLCAGNFIVIPIPLSRQRLRARGYNQAELIARHLLRKINGTGIDLALSLDVLTRVKHTKPQSDTTSVAERQENIRGVYTARNGAAPRNGINTPLSILGRNILLIDDVSTSGSTFSEATCTLKSAGAARIIGLAVAKT
jgi:ComF family protein